MSGRIIATLIVKNVTNEVEVDMCYTVPLITSFFTTYAWKKKRTARLLWLNLLLYGASVFGVIDHLYNGELFLVSEYWVRDLFLGFLITLSVFLVWGVLLFMSRGNKSIARCVVD